MTFPFSIKRTIEIKQTENIITSEAYIIAHLEEEFENYGMTIQRLSENELFLIVMNPIRTGALRDSLRNLRVKVITDEKTIKIRLETETILFFFLGLIPFVMYPFKTFDISFLISLIASCIFWSIGYFIKFISLNSLRKDVISKMKELI